jgi:hypothetical protein
MKNIKKNKSKIVPPSTMSIKGDIKDVKDVRGTKSFRLPKSPAEPKSALLQRINKDTRARRQTRLFSSF